MESEFLVFDNLPFKLTVIEVLMYQLKLLGEPYNAMDEFFERYAEDYLTVSEEESLSRLEEYIERGTRYFSELQIPRELAPKICYLYTGEEMSVYGNINPQWLDWEKYEDGAMFAITDISEREIKQFPNLEGITFNMYLDPPEELLRKLEDWGIEINPQD